MEKNIAGGPRIVRLYGPVKKSYYAKIMLAIGTQE
jgi:hypothetical protein